MTTEFEKAALAYNSQKTLCGQLKRNNETLIKEKEELSNSVASVQQLGDHLQVAIETLTTKLSNEHSLNQQLEFKIKVIYLVYFLSTKLLIG